MWTILTACRCQTGLTFGTRDAARKAGMGHQVARMGEGIWN